MCWCQVTFPVMLSPMSLVLNCADLGKLEVSCAADSTLNLGIVCMITLVDSWPVFAGFAIVDPADTDVPPGVLFAIVT